MKQLSLLICATLLFSSCGDLRNKRLLKKGKSEQNANDLAQTEAYSFLNGEFKVDSEDTYLFNSSLSLVTRTLREELNVDDTDIECVISYKSGYSIYEPTQEELEVLSNVSSKTATMKLYQTVKEVTYIDSSSSDKSKCESYVETQSDLIMAGKPATLTNFFEKLSDTTIIEVITSNAYNK